MTEGLNDELSEIQSIILQLTPEIEKYIQNEYQLIISPRWTLNNTIEKEIQLIKKNEVRPSQNTQVDKKPQIFDVAESPNSKEKNLDQESKCLQRNIKCPIYNCSLIVNSYHALLVHIEEHCIANMESFKPQNYEKQIELEQFQKNGNGGIQAVSPNLFGKYGELQEQIVHRLDNQFQDHSKNSNTRYQCPIDDCSKSFSRKSRLKNHLKIHLRVNLFQCPIASCQKQFTERPNLKIHLRTHTQEKPFLCSICKKAFSTKGNMQDHERRHIKLKPFQCQYCQKQFYRKNVAKQHVESCFENQNKQINQNQNQFSHRIFEEEEYKLNHTQIHQSIEQNTAQDLQVKESFQKNTVPLVTYEHKLSLISQVTLPKFNSIFQINRSLKPIDDEYRMMGGREAIEQQNYQRDMNQIESFNLERKLVLSSHESQEYQQKQFQRPLLNQQQRLEELEEINSFKQSINWKQYSKWFN